jgi:uncharacterized protein involved in exopolysaccharide biosynthesis
MKTSSDRPETTPSPEVQDIVLDSSLAMTIFRRRVKAWLAFGSFAFVVVVLYCIFVMPQSYATRVSLQLQRPSAPTSSLGQLLNMPGGGGGKTYLGVLQSRLFAEKVEKKVRIQQIYHFPTSDEAVELIQKGVKADENIMDGLTYINVTLPTLARFAPDPNGLRAKVKKATATIANEYAAQLGVYLEDNDTERETALRKQSKIELAQARREYDGAVNKLAMFVTNRENGKALAVSSGTSTPGPTTAQSETAGGTLSGLYSRRAELEQQIRAANVKKEKITDLLNGPEKNLLDLAEEDPLLNEARARVNEAMRKLDDLRVSFADTHPDVVQAKKQLDLEQGRLKEKVASLLKESDSDSIRLQALQASYEVVERQIQEVERSFQRGIERATDMDMLKNEVELRYEVLKTTYSRYAEMSITTVSGKNRMNIIDAARPPLYGKPGLTTMVVMSLFLPLPFIGLWFIIEYVLASARAPRYAAATVVDRVTTGSNGR